MQRLTFHNVPNYPLASFIFWWSREVEPREEIRGEIARTYMYMDSVYPGRGIISKKNWKLFESWHRSDPVDEWECERAKRIEKIQGNRNEIVLKKC